MSKNHAVPMFFNGKKTKQFAIASRNVVLHPSGCRCRSPHVSIMTIFTMRTTGSIRMKIANQRKEATNMARRKARTKVSRYLKPNIFHQNVTRLVPSCGTVASHTSYAILATDTTTDIQIAV